MPSGIGELPVALSPVPAAEWAAAIVGAHKRKPLEEIAPGFDPESWSAWAAEGLRLARVAPSAVNRQPWRFEFEPAPAAAAPAGEAGTLEPGPGGAGATRECGAAGTVTISTVTRGLEGNISRRLDCGIAMLHFEVGAQLMGAAGRWELLEAPAVARYNVSLGGSEPPAG